MTAPTTWIREAACTGLWGLFDAAADGDVQAVATAKDVCSACSAKSLCLADAIERHDTWSVAGGLDPDQRADLEAREWLLEPRLIAHEPSRACYSRGCDHPDCREQNRLYIASRPRVTERGAI